MSSKLKLILALVVALSLMAVLITGCETDETEDAEEPAKEEEVEETEGEPSEDEDLTFGMVIKYPGTPFIEAFQEAAHEAAEEVGAEVIVRDGEADAHQIMNHIDTFIVEDIDGFIMAGAEDLQAIVPGIEQLNEEGIPVTALDTCPEGGEVDYFISADIEGQSARAAEQFIEGIKDRHDGEVPEGTVIEITGDIRDMFTQAASDGFRSVVGEYDQLEIAQGEGNWNNIDAQQRTSDLLTRHGDDVLGVYVQTPDIMGPGAVEAILGAGEDPADYGITGIWMGPEGIELINEGHVEGIVAMPAYVPAKMAIYLLNDIIAGEDTPEIGETVDLEEYIGEDGELWEPAEVKENPWADEGRYLELNAPIVPEEVDPDDERLWENRLDHLF